MCASSRYLRSPRRPALGPRSPRWFRAGAQRSRLTGTEWGQHARARPVIQNRRPITESPRPRAAGAAAGSQGRAPWQAPLWSGSCGLGGLDWLGLAGLGLIVDRLSPTRWNRWCGGVSVTVSICPPRPGIAEMDARFGALDAPDVVDAHAFRYCRSRQAFPLDYLTFQRDRRRDAWLGFR